MKRSSLALTLLIAFPAHSQTVTEADGVQRSLEMPAHRSLLSVMADDTTLLSPFETDGCSGGMSWSWRTVADLFPGFQEAQGAHPPWEGCCVVHDRAYHAAGGATDAARSYDARLEADVALRQCVEDEGESQLPALAVRYEVTEDQVRMAYTFIATSMYNAVRFGGGPCSGLPWRWGFGYPGCVPGF